MNTDKLKSKLITVAASMTRGRHLQSIQGLSESQKSISTRKLSIAVEEIEDRQKVDAAFLMRVFDYIVELERANETK